MKLKAIIFDVNETLLDLKPLELSVGRALGGRKDLLPLWFSKMLHYSLVETLSDGYQSFSEVGTASLMMVAQTQGIEISYDDAKQAIVTPLQSLPPHSDVVPALEELSKTDLQIVCLTNSSHEGVANQFERAELTKYFDKLYSVETVKKFKPHPAPYEHVIADLRLEPSEVMMVTVHEWDLLGAHRVGLKTAFVARPGKALYPIGPKPNHLIQDLGELAGLLS